MVEVLNLTILENPLDGRSPLHPPSVVRWRSMTVPQLGVTQALATRQSISGIGITLGCKANQDLAMPTMYPTTIIIIPTITSLPCRLTAMEGQTQTIITFPLITLAHIKRDRLTIEQPS